MNWFKWMNRFTRIFGWVKVRSVDNDSGKIIRTDWGRAKNHPYIQ